MRTFLSPQNTHELEELDGKVRKEEIANYGLAISKNMSLILLS